MRENGLRNEEIIRTIIIREYESYFAVMYTTWAVVKMRPGKIQACAENPWPLRNRWSALPTEPTSQPGAGHYDGSK